LSTYCARCELSERTAFENFDGQNKVIDVNMIEFFVVAFSDGEDGSVCTDARPYGALQVLNQVLEPCIQRHGLSDRFGVVLNSGDISGRACHEAYLRVIKVTNQLRNGVRGIMSIGVGEDDD